MHASSLVLHIHNLQLAVVASIQVHQPCIMLIVQSDKLVNSSYWWNSELQACSSRFHVQQLQSQVQPLSQVHHGSITHGWWHRASMGMREATALHSSILTSFPTVVPDLGLRWLGYLGWCKYGTLHFVSWIIYQFSAHWWICSKQLSHRRMPSPVCTASLSNLLHSGQIRATFRGSTVLASNPGIID